MPRSKSPARWLHARIFADPDQPAVLRATLRAFLEARGDEESAGVLAMLDRFLDGLSTAAAWTRPLDPSAGLEMRFSVEEERYLLELDGVGLVPPEGWVAPPEGWGVRPAEGGWTWSIALPRR